MVRGLWREQADHDTQTIPDNLVIVIAATPGAAVPSRDALGPDYRPRWIRAAGYLAAGRLVSGLWLDRRAGWHLGLRIWLRGHETRA
jgi:hypothetical protein